MVIIRYIVCLILVVALPVDVWAAESINANSVVDCVDPFIGTGKASLPTPAGIAAKWVTIKEAKGNLHPGACLPFGMVSASSYADTYPTGYGLKKTRRYGISHFQQSGTGHIGRYYNFLLVTPTLDTTDNGKRGVSREVASPGYYACNFDDIRAEVTVSRHAVFHQYQFPVNKARHLKIDASNILLGGGAGKNAEITTNGNSAKGVVTFSGNLPLYFYAQTDLADATIVCWQDDKRLKETSLSIKNAKGTNFGFTFSGKPGNDALRLKVGFSFRSTEDAENNVNKELQNWNIETVRNTARSEWATYLSRVQVNGGTEAQRQIFYTALYHSLIKPVDLTGESPFWNNETPLYLDIATMWDVYKTQMPLILSIYPERGSDIVKTIISLYRHFSIGDSSRNAFLLAPGLGPSFSHQGTALCHQVIAHAHAIGLKGIDWKTAWPIILKAFGKVPPSGKMGVDDSYSAACLAPIAKDVGDTAAEKRLGSRRTRWKAFYDPKTAKLSGRKFYQGSAWNYSYMVWHDVDDLIKLHGSEERFLNDLDILFGFGDGAPGQKIGRFQGLNNQADIDAPYMYAYVGRHDRIADVVRAAMTHSFGTGRGGLAGNDDSGALSAWYVWNAIGLFPIVGQNLYFIGSPLFEETVITIGSKPFKISAPKTSDNRRYVVGATLNGKPLKRGFLRYAEIVQGGALTLSMSSTPGTWPEIKLSKAFPSINQGE